LGEPVIGRRKGFAAGVLSVGATDQLSTVGSPRTTATRDRNTRVGVPIDEWVADKITSTDLGCVLAARVPVRRACWRLAQIGHTDRSNYVVGDPLAPASACN
jgi:hypothetical protein